LEEVTEEHEDGELSPSTGSSSAEEGSSPLAKPSKTPKTNGACQPKEGGSRLDKANNERLDKNANNPAPTKLYGLSTWTFEPPTREEKARRLEEKKAKELENTEKNQPIIVVPSTPSSTPSTDVTSAPTSVSNNPGGAPTGLPSLLSGIILPETPHIAPKPSTLAVEDSVSALFAAECNSGPFPSTNRGLGEGDENADFDLFSGVPNYRNLSKTPPKPSPAGEGAPGSAHTTAVIGPSPPTSLFLETESNGSLSNPDLPSGDPPIGKSACNDQFRDKNVTLENTPEVAGGKKRALSDNETPDEMVVEASQIETEFTEKTEEEHGSSPRKKSFVSIKKK
jgi:hypothetical protein